MHSCYSISQLTTSLQAASEEDQIMTSLANVDFGEMDLDIESKELATTIVGEDVDIDALDAADVEDDSTLDVGEAAALAKVRRVQCMAEDSIMCTV